MHHTRAAKVSDASSACTVSAHICGSFSVEIASCHMQAPRILSWFLRIEMSVYSCTTFMYTCVCSFKFYKNFPVAQQPKSGTDRIVLKFTDGTHSDTHTHTHTPGKIPLNRWSARRRRRYLHNRQQTKETNIQALSGIQIRDSSNQATADLSLRPHVHWDRRIFTNKRKITSHTASTLSVVPPLQIEFIFCGQRNIISIFYIISATKGVQMIYK